MLSFLQAYLIAQIPLSIISFLVLLLVYSYHESIIPLTPATIYKNFTINWFGAILIYIVFAAIFPAVAIAGILIWLCTVGRKKDEK